MACILCESVIHSNQRRRLQAESARNVLCFLLEYCSNQPQVLQQPGSFICRPCVKLVECTQKKRKDLKQNEAIIKQYIDKLLQKSDNGDREEFSQEESTCAMQKRTASEAELPVTPNRLQKRFRYETPIRETLNRMLPVASSPAVTVSDNTFDTNDHNT